MITAQLTVGQVNAGEHGRDSRRSVTDRLYIQPGVMLKFNKGSGLDVINPGASLNVGSRSYITGFDQNNNYGPGSTGFVAESASDPQVLFTSLFDDTATTTLVPNPINVTGETSSSNLGPGSWGSVGIQSGALAVINAATFQYGGGAMNTPTLTLPSQSVLAFLTNYDLFPFPPTTDTLGTHVYVTNNNFFHNFDAAMQIEPNGLLAGDPLHPLVSGHPFIHGNVLQSNGIDGMAVVTSRAYLFNTASWQYIGPVEANLLPNTSLSNLGMQIVDTNPTDGLVDGWLPINELPTAAQLPQTLSGQADLKAVTYGAAINEADYSTFANVASQQTGVTGAGVTVGVLSDSFNNQGGYATDVASGDLPTNVNVLQEATRPTKDPFDDEGRAMAQNIYHIAPGASLAFATGEPDTR